MMQNGGNLEFHDCRSQGNGLEPEQGFCGTNWHLSILVVFLVAKSFSVPGLYGLSCLVELNSKFERLMLPTANAVWKPWLWRLENSIQTCASVRWTMCVPLLYTLLRCEKCIYFVDHAVFVCYCNDGTNLGSCTWISLEFPECSLISPQFWSPDQVFRRTSNIFQTPRMWKPTHTCLNQMVCSLLLSRTKYRFEGSCSEFNLPISGILSHRMSWWNWLLHGVQLPIQINPAPIQSHCTSDSVSSIHHFEHIRHHA